jgi:hypothetical protein
MQLRPSTALIAMGIVKNLCVGVRWRCLAVSVKLKFRSDLKIFWFVSFLQHNDQTTMRPIQDS